MLAGANVASWGWRASVPIEKENQIEVECKEHRH